jgi:hypothetical protein
MLVLEGNLWEESIKKKNKKKDKIEDLEEKLKKKFGLAEFTDLNIISQNIYKTIQEKKKK